MNTPNKITLFRLLLIPVFVVVYMLQKTSTLWAAVIFALASVTDFLDGYLARRDHLVTTFGKFMDPLADKMLTQAAFILLVWDGLIPAWIVILIVCRELLITGFRTVAASNGVTIAASRWGKYKTATQMVTILLYLVRQTLFSGWRFPLAECLLYLALFFTVLSGFDYIWKNRSVLDLNTI